MDFDLTEEQRHLKEKARAFMEKEIIPIADEYERKGPLTKPQVQALLRKLSPLGYISGAVPKEYGGTGLDYISRGLLLEELARAWAALAMMVTEQASPAWTIAQAGTEEQKRRFIPPLLAADKLGCNATTEANAGSNIAAIETTANLKGDHYVVNGTKKWIGGGAIGDLVLLLAVTDKEKGTRGMSLFIVDKEVSPFTQRDLRLIGVRAQRSAEMIFKDCRVPKENLLGELGSGYKFSLMRFEDDRCISNAQAVGIAQAAIDASIKYAQQRYQFGKPIGAFQLIQEMIADMIIETEASRWLTYRALYLVNKGGRWTKEISIAKAYATEAAVRTTSKAIQIHGALGLSEESPVERYFRDARCFTIPGGTTEMHKLIIGREALGISAFF